MINIRFKKQQTESAITPQQIAIQRTELNRFRKRITEIKVKNNYSTDEEAINFLENQYYNISVHGQYNNTSKVTPIPTSDFFAYTMLKRFETNPSLLMDIFDNLTERERKQIIIRAQQNTPGYRYVGNLIEDGKTFLRDILPGTLEYLNISNENFKENKISINERSKIREDFISLISQNRREYHSKIMNFYISNICTTVSFLTDIGYVTDNVGIYNRQMSECSLEELRISSSKKQDNKSELSSVSAFKNPDILKKYYSLDALVAIKLFYENKLVKELGNFQKYKFLSSRLSSNFRDITDEEIKKELGRYEIMRAIYREVYSEFEASIQYGNGVIEEKFSADDIIKKYARDYADMYYGDTLDDKEKEEIFSNDFLPYGQSIDAATHSFLYSMKDYSMQSLISILFDRIGNSKVVNWGYIPEEKEGLNSLKRNCKMVEIGIDVWGLNGPIRLHISKDLLTSTVETCTGKRKIPVYIGSEDWAVPDFGDEKKYLPTYVLGPIDSDARQIVRRKVKKEEYPKKMHDYMEHMNLILNEVRAPRFKVTQFINLDTGEPVNPEQEKE